jgi:putative Ca2+/H+ antiporter (TMEM165/GDT1 family)
MGDKTQLATIALAARFSSTIVVTIGTTLGMMLTNGAAVFAGDKLSQNARLMKYVRWGAAVLFIVFGLISALAAIRHQT